MTPEKSKRTIKYRTLRPSLTKYRHWVDCLVGDKHTHDNTMEIKIQELKKKHPVLFIYLPKKVNKQLDLSKGDHLLYKQTSEGVLIWKKK